MATRAMPKASKKKKFYAVRRGREGPKIYDDWEETKLNVTLILGHFRSSILRPS
ncbi:hypothetical protein PHLGIDRAFT_375611 [Phlebiopsis gigantea 11061_1 CR5-6]|uniref:Ribonuclease H1 N-terminal domain-containing protein n=1 Tax=Phlebiopsis gigantea (strain 11061_1 CR5-6) TaxID=745531 RepID=A0A0C3NTH4_PHLG1|nr:hypothetical protein PHLGIDRAFT_375611 [Phlebiopsis gigantea 11061_1 CR5-6]